MEQNQRPQLSEGQSIVFRIRIRKQPTQQHRNYIYINIYIHTHTYIYELINFLSYVILVYALLHGNVKFYLFNLLWFLFIMFSLTRIFQQTKRDAHNMEKIRSLALAFLSLPFCNFLPNNHL